MKLELIFFIHYYFVGGNCVLTDDSLGWIRLPSADSVIN